MGLIQQYIFAGDRINMIHIENNLKDAIDIEFVRFCGMWKFIDKLLMRNFVGGGKSSQKKSLKI